MCARTSFLYLTFSLDVRRDKLPLSYVFVRRSQGQASSILRFRYMCAGTSFLYHMFSLDVRRDKLPLSYVFDICAQGQACSYVLVRYPMYFLWGKKSRT